MILVDISVGFDHLHSKDEALVLLLNNNQVLVHPFVFGELACGNLADRGEILTALADWPALPTVTETEVLYFIEQNQLMGRGIGYVGVDGFDAADTAMDAG